jgi:hypothetical protein
MATMTMNPLLELLTKVISWQPAKIQDMQTFDFAPVNDAAPVASTSRLPLPSPAATKEVTTRTNGLEESAAANEAFASDWPSTIQRVGHGFWNQGNTWWARS